MLIGTLIKRKPTGCITPSRIVGNNKIFTYKADICEQFNQYFINVGLELASTIPQNNENPTEYMKKTPLSSFVVSQVTEAQVSRLFSNLVRLICGTADHGTAEAAEPVEPTEPTEMTVLLQLPLVKVMK